MATESPNLNSFLLAARNPGGDGILSLASNNEGLVTRTGRIARWVSHFRRAENRELSRRFVDALRQEYGAELTREVTRTHRLARVLERGKPLSARQVTRADSYARALKADHHKSNMRLARALVDRSQGTGVPMLQTAISKAALTLFPNDRTVGWIVDYNQVASAVWDAIVLEAGGSGASLLTGMRAKEVVERVAKRKLLDAYQARLALADEALDLLRPGSIARSMLEEKLASLGLPPNVQEDALSPDAFVLCRKRFDTAIGTAMISADELDDDATLRHLADAILTRFFEERKAACARVDELDGLEEGERSAMRALAIRDDIPAELVSSLGRAYRSIKEDLRALAGPLPPAEMQRSIFRLRTAITEALQESRCRVTVENQDRVHRSAWRLLLAPGGEAQATALLHQFESDGNGLRGLAGAVIWYRHDFPSNEEWSRAFKNVDEELDGKPIYDNESRHTAVHYAVLMRSLHEVLAENTGSSPDGVNQLEANGNPDDGTVNVVRNLGIPYPAPERLGWGNLETPPSNGARALMKTALERHVETAGRERHPSGLVKECAGFLRAGDRVPQEQRERVRARFIVDGEALEGDADEVAERLREFCTDGDGNLNEAMLTGISLVANRAPFRCVYEGCMNPDRPDLALMNGYPTGVFLGHTYSLWKNAPDDVRLQAWEQVKPLYFHPVDQYTLLPDAEDSPRDDAHSGNRVLLSDESDFQSLIEIGFDPHTWQPEFKDVQISYSLDRGMPSTRWFIEHPELESRSGAGDTPLPGP